MIVSILTNRITLSFSSDHLPRPDLIPGGGCEITIARTGHTGQQAQLAAAGIFAALAATDGHPEAIAA